MQTDLDTDIAKLSLRNGLRTIPDDILHATDPAVQKLRTYVKSVPYSESVESYAKMQELLDFIILRLIQSLESKDFDPGFIQWDSMLT